MVDFIPLEDMQTVSCSRLSAGLAAYRAATGMSLPEDWRILEYLKAAARRGAVQALAAVTSREAVGVAAWYPEHGVGVLDLLYVLPEVSPEVAHALLRYAMDDLRRRGRGDSIYAELPPVQTVVDAALTAEGFVGVQRWLMQIDLVGRGEWPVIRLPCGYTLSAWRDERVEQAAQVIYRANIGTLDALIIPELSTPDSTLCIVRQSLQGRYGAFDRAASGIVEADGQVVAASLATRRRGGQGFTAEICVLPEYRRQGLARALMHQAHAVFAADGLTEALLGVTVGNPALLLYESLGYSMIGSVWSYIWPRPQSWPDTG